MGKIFVTGPGGTVGRELVRQLQANSIPFRAGYHSAEKVSAARECGIEAVQIDFAHPTDLQAAFDGCEKLFLLGPNTVDQAEIELAAVDAARSTGVRHIVKQSVLHAQEEAFSLARVHRVVEKSIEASGIAWTFLRPNSFMQNTVTFMGDTICGENSFYTASGDVGVSYVDVKDIAAVAVRALSEPIHEGHAYALTGPKALTHDQLAEELSGILGRKITHVSLSSDDYLQGMLASGMPAELAERMLDLERYIREGRPGFVTGDVAAVTGEAPRSFSEFARETAATGIWDAAAL